MHRLVLIDGTCVSTRRGPEAGLRLPGGLRLGRPGPLRGPVRLPSEDYRGSTAGDARPYLLAHAVAVHSEMRAGDELVGDRAFVSFAQLVLCWRRGLRAIFRGHQRRHTQAPTGWSGTRSRSAAGLGDGRGVRMPCWRRSRCGRCRCGYGSQAGGSETADGCAKRSCYW
jgi:hypothetical protein